MKFTDGTIATVAANRIFQRTRTVVDTMDKVMIQEKVDSPRYGRFVYRVQLILQIEQAEALSNRIIAFRISRRMAVGLISLCFNISK